MRFFHNPSHVIAFVAFSAVMAGTPGPANALLIAICARVGFRRGLPSLLGQVTGMGAMLFATALGLGKALLAHPLILLVLKWGGAAILCWMAWRIAFQRHTTQRVAGERVGFFGMAAFMWANPKGWLTCIGAAAFLNPGAGSALAQAVILGVIFILVALPSCLPWLALGATLQRFLRTPRAERNLNLAMGGVLAASVALLVWPHY